MNATASAAAADLPAAETTAAAASTADTGTTQARAADFRTVKFRETDYRTGCVTIRDVEAPVINRFSDHVLVRMPDGASLRVQEKRR